MLIRMDLLPLFSAENELTVLEEWLKKAAGAIGLRSYSGTLVTSAFEGMFGGPKGWATNKIP